MVPAHYLATGHSKSYDGSMKLTNKEAASLASAELRVEAPFSQIRKDAGYREHTVRYSLRSLLARNIIHPVPFINLHRLGYTVYTVLFSAAADKRNSKQKLLESLMSAPYVLWVGEFGGEYQYGIGFCCKQFSELIYYMRDLSKKHEQIFFDKAISVQISTTIFPRKYLWTKKVSVAPLTSTFSKMPPIDIDELDARILSALTTHSLLSHRQIALKLKMPLSTLELRVKKLKDQGVILSTIYGVDSARVGRESFKLLVFTKGLDSNFSANLHAFCALRSEVVSLIDGLGAWGYEIGVEVISGEDVMDLIQDLYDAFPGLINTIRPLTKFRYPKMRFFPEVA